MCGHFSNLAEWHRVQKIRRRNCRTVFGIQIYVETKNVVIAAHQVLFTFIIPEKPETDFISLPKGC